MKYGTISSGVECHSLACEDLGDEPIFFSEIATAQSKLLKEHYPDVVNFGDMTRVDYDKDKGVVHNAKYDGYELMDEKVLGFNPVDAEYAERQVKYGGIDLVSGGTPCTDCSVAGKRLGAQEGSGTRSALAFQLPRIGEAVGARWILFENVPGIFSSNSGRDFAWLIHRMTEYGYTSIAWRTLDAQYVRTDKHPRAVPQRRRRVWLVAYRGSDWRVPCEALFEPIKALGDEPPVRTVGVGFVEKMSSSWSSRKELEDCASLGACQKEETPLSNSNSDSDSNSSQPADELFEFNEFMNGTKETIIKILVDKGICISPEAHRKELESAKNSVETCQGDLFGGDLFGPVEPHHQGRGLKAKDLALNLPDEARIGNVGLTNLFSWAKTVSSEVLYCGRLFKEKLESQVGVGESNLTSCASLGVGSGETRTTADQQKENEPPITRSNSDSNYSTDDLDPKLLSNLGNAGFLSDGIVCTMKMPEWNAGITEEELATMPPELAALYDGDVCGLSDILEENPDPKYKLSWRACYGILKRAMNRGKMLPIELAYALVERIVDQAPIVKWYAMNGKDTVKKEGQLSERAIAKIAFDDYIEVECHWADVKEQAPKKGDETAEIEEESEESDEEEQV